MISFIVPCFDEVDNVPRLHDELLPVVRAIIQRGEGDYLSAEMIFVDDGSHDGTLTKLETNFAKEDGSNLEFKFLRHQKNLGLGAAIRTGFCNAKGEIVVTVDSDGTYEFSDIPALLALLSSNVDIVTASPYHPQGSVVGVPRFRLVLSRGSSFLYRLLVDWHIHTYTCLFRAYRSKVVREIRFDSNGFLAGTEILVNAILRGYKAVEFPAVLRKRAYGASKARIIETIVAHLVFQTRVLFYRIRLVFAGSP